MRWIVVSPYLRVARGMLEQHKDLDFTGQESSPSSHAHTSPLTPHADIFTIHNLCLCLISQSTAVASSSKQQSNSAYCAIAIIDYIPVLLPNSSSLFRIFAYVFLIDRFFTTEERASLVYNTISCVLIEFCIMCMVMVGYGFIYLWYRFDVCTYTRFFTNLCCICMRSMLH